MPWTRNCDLWPSRTSTGGRKHATRRKGDQRFGQAKQDIVSLVGHEDTEISVGSSGFSSDCRVSWR